MSELAASKYVLAPSAMQAPFISEKVVRRFLGLVFAFTAIGLWLAPGASPATGILLIKTGLTGVLTLSAIAALLPRS